MKSPLIIAISSIFLLPLSVAASIVVSSNVATGGLVTFDANSLALTSGSTSGSFSTGVSLAFDQAGRLFGLDESRALLREYNPVSLAVFNQTTVHGINGLAARNGVLYSSDAGSGGLVTFDANSLTLTSGSISGTFSTGVSLAFDQAGRLFSLNESRALLREYDPVSLAVLNQTTLASGLDGLAVIPGIPEPSVAVFGVAASLVILLRRNRLQPSA